MAEKNTADIGFEKQIWNAACVLRGNMDASEYKGVVLGLIFLKYISDRFEDKYNQLVADGDGFEEDRDEYTSEGIFFVPAGARWSDVSAKAHDPEIGQVIDDAMRAIEKENARLKDILPKNFARPELDKRRLGEVVDLFTNIKMIDHGSEKDILGRTYEYCLSMFAEQEGKRGGEFFTPSCVVRTLVEVLQPFKGRVYDPCCGSGGMFVQSAKFVENHSGNIQRNYFVISNLNNERLVRQSGSFLISGKYNVQLKGKIRQSIVKRAYSDVQDEFELQSFRIPAGRKSAILEELSFYNINEGTLFPELEHQMAYIKSNYANIQKPMADRFVKIEVPVTNIREVCDLDISDDKVDEIIQRVLRDEINPAFFDESYIAIQENLMPDWYRKEIGLSKVRLALTDTLDNGTPIGRAMAKRAAQSIVEKIVNAIAQESNTATSDNS